MIRACVHTCVCVCVLRCSELAVEAKSAELARLSQQVALLMDDARALAGVQGALR